MLKAKNPACKTTAGRAAVTLVATLGIICSGAAVAAVDCEALITPQTIEKTCGSTMKMSKTLGSSRIDGSSKKCQALFHAGGGKGSFSLKINEHKPKRALSKLERLEKRKLKKSQPDGVAQDKQNQMPYTANFRKQPSVHETAFSYDMIDDGMKVTMHYLDFVKGPYIVQLRSESALDGSHEAICDTADLKALSATILSQLP